MNDGSSVPTSSVYASHYDSDPRPSEEAAALSGLSEQLSRRRDKGAAFWQAVRESIDTLDDGEPVPPRRVVEAQGHVVYYVRFGDRIKIGTTSNLRQRMGNTPHDEVLATEPGGRDLERQRHLQFADHRIGRSEWFHAHDDLLSHVEMLNSMS